MTDEYISSLVLELLHSLQHNYAQDNVQNIEKTKSRMTIKSSFDLLQGRMERIIILRLFFSHSDTTYLLVNGT